MQIINSQELLNNMRASEYGHYNQKSRKKVHDKVLKIAYPSLGEGKRPLTTREMADILGVSSVK